MRIREITPFLHASLYHYPRFESFEDIQSCGIHEWGVLSKETVKQIMLVREKSRISVSESALPILGNECRKHIEPHSGSTRFTTDASELLTSPGENLEFVVSDVEVRVSSEEPNVPRNPTPVSLRSTIFSPRKQDSLFWSMYIAKHGVGEFFEIGSKYMNKEIEEKSKIMEFMKTNRPLLKSMKITSDKGQEIMGDLMTNKKTELTVVCAFALFYQVRIWVVSEDSRTYFEFLPHNSDDNTPVYVIHRSKPKRSEPLCSDARNEVEASPPNVDGLRTSALGSYTRFTTVSYTVDTHVLEETLIRIRDDMFRLESPTFHMKGISNYKITDLEKIIKILGITRPPEITKWKKNDMYNTIRLHCMTAWLDR
jgi:hypothetical protein